MQISNDYRYLWTVVMRGGDSFGQTSLSKADISNLIENNKIWCIYFRVVALPNIKIGDVVAQPNGCIVCERSLMTNPAKFQIEAPKMESPIWIWKLGLEYPYSRRIVYINTFAREVII